MKQKSQDVMNASIKIKIGLRANPIIPTKKLKIKHIFKNPFTDEELFDVGEIQCLDFYEIAVEKFSAAVSRKPIASRDFYDLSYFIKNGLDFGSKKFIKLANKD